jgi:hypothetical protein
MHEEGRTEQTARKMIHYKVSILVLSETILVSVHRSDVINLKRNAAASRILSGGNITGREDLILFLATPRAFIRLEPFSS